MNRLFFACVPVVLIGCGIVQEFGTSDDAPKAGDDAGNDASVPSLQGDGGAPAPAPLVPTFSWMNPLPTGNDLRGIWGTSDDDVWIAGEHGTVARWDGSKASLVYDGKVDEEFYAMWGSGKDDMWIAGRAGARGQVLHWDGTSWSPSYTLGERSIHALWGTSSNDFWALGEPGTLFHFNGTTFDEQVLISECDPHRAVLRDLWGSSNSDIWAVGDGGAIYHYREKGEPQCPDWARATSAAAGLADPFASEHAYFGIWGSAADDVWAAFLDAPSASSPPKIGFSHFDGTAWRVAQLQVGGWGVPDQSIEPSRRGHRMWGSSANDIVALVASTTWRWNGTTWSPSYIGPTRLGEPGWTATWASANRGIMAVGPAGTFAHLRPDGSWSSVVPGRIHRENLSGVSVAPDGSVWAVSSPWLYAPGRLVRWTTSGWTEVAPLPLEDDVTLTRIKALSNDDVWVAGHVDGPGPNDDYAFVTRLTDGAWGEIQRVPVTAIGGLAVASATNAWVVGNERAARWDGTKWTSIPVGGDLRDVTIAGDDVWIAGTGRDGKGVVLRWDGSKFQPLVRSGSHFFNIWASGPNDVWAVGSEVLHYDGSTWNHVGETDFFASDVWGSGPDDVWLVSEGKQRGIIHHWDGASFSTRYEVSSPLQGISGNAKDNVWFVGHDGATVRFATSAWKPPH